MRRVVSDTGPLVHLAEARSLDILSRIETVLVAPAVASELVVHVPDWLLRKPAHLVTERLTPQQQASADAWVQGGLLDEGEAESIALAQQARADCLLTDDAAARLFAQTLGIEVHGSLGVVLWAAGQKHLSREEAAAALDRLANSSLWISARVLAEARAALDRLCQ